MAQQLFDINLRAALFAIALTFSTARAQTLTVLHTFTGVPDGREPVAGLTMDAAGNLYGTTYYGGTHESGLVYKLARQGAGWILRPLYSFTGGDDGAQPIGGVTIGSDGSLYGTTSVGGQHGAGVVYKLSPPATICKSFACPWTETPLYQFTGGVDGGNPDAAPIFDSTGNLYGTAGTGGTGNNGVIYRLKPAQNGWIDSVLYSFTGKPDSSGPFSGLTFDGNGNLYGTTLFGGSGYGTVYQLTPSGSAWTEKVIYAFQGLNDGSTPYAGLVVDPDGNLYGSSFYFGAGNGGSIFELSPSSGSWIFTILYSPDVPEGGVAGTLARTSNGTLYGTLFSGSNESCSGYGCGNVFQLSPSNGRWVYTSLYVFTDGADGGNPEGSLIFDTAGNLYGTTTGSLGGDGSVFELTP